MPSELAFAQLDFCDCLANSDFFFDQDQNTAQAKSFNSVRKKGTGKSVYILDEPTTGLHADDIRKLLDVLNQLVDAGNTVIVIEHNMDVIKTADYIIDLGPEGGDDGGYVIGCGTPEEITQISNSYTGQFLEKILARTSR